MSRSRRCMEDRQPTVSKVNGVKYGGSRYNSERGFIYYKHKQTKRELVFICKNQKKRKGGCNARLRQNISTGCFWNCGKAHNHPPEMTEQRRLQAVNAIALEAATSRDHPREIFERVRIRFRDVLLSYNSAIQRRIQRSKRRKQPPIPMNREEFREILSEYPEYSETLDGQDDFFIKHVQATDGSEAFLFISPSLLENLGEVTELHADGTFRTVPPMFHQLFTLHFSRFGQIFPFVFALMTSKSRVLYDAIFQCVLEEFAERFPNKEVNITNFMSDYEQAIQGAAMEAFGCRTTGCFFHYSQAIWRKVQKYGIQCAYRTTPIVSYIVRELIALALLPETDIPEGLLDIIMQHNDELQGESEIIKEGILKLYLYYFSTWIVNIGPEVFSVFKRRNRTNNLVECWHRWFARRCGGAHINIWDFIHVLKQSESSKALDFAVESSLGVNHRTSQPPRQRQRNFKIRKLQEDFKNGMIELREFLEFSRYLTEPDLQKDVSRKRCTNDDGAPTRPEKRRRFLATTPRIREPEIGSDEDTDSSSSSTTEDEEDAFEQAQILLTEAEAFLSQL